MPVCSALKHTTHRGETHTVTSAWSPCLPTVSTVLSYRTLPCSLLITAEWWYQAQRNCKEFCRHISLLLHSLSLSLSIPLPLPLSLCLALLSVYVYLSLSLHISVAVCVCLSLCLYVCLSVCLSLYYICLSVSLNLTLFLSMFFSLSLPLYLTLFISSLHIFPSNSLHVN